MHKQYITESRLILIVGLAQFINILDFMMVMPLGPDFATSLNIPLHAIGYIGGSYTFAAAIAGLSGALFLDQFQRRKAFLIAFTGLIVATVSAAFAFDLYSIMAARILAGIFGGPMSALAIAMVADMVPPERRGMAMGKVMGSFAAASVIGVPFGLELSHYFGWRAPFLSFGVIGTIIFILSHKFLVLPPRHITHFSGKQQLKNIGHLFKNKTVIASYGFMALAMFAGFMIIPNIASHLLMNWDFPRKYLGVLYLLGGSISFFGMRFAGKIVDKTSSTRASLYFTIILIISIFLGFVWWKHLIPVYLIFPLFMLSMTARNVAGQALSSKVPPAYIRASYMSVQSAVTHLSCALGAFSSSVLLHDGSDGHLYGMENVGTLAIIINILVPLLFLYVERRVAKKVASPDPAITPAA